MEITLDEGQEYSEPSEYEETTYEEEVVETETKEYEDDEEWQMAMEEENAEETVPYSKWLNELKGNGWEQVKGSYDAKDKTCRVRRV
jgi:hypothetical protein